MGYLQEMMSQDYFDLVTEGDRLFELGNLVEAKNRFERAKELFDRLVGAEATRLDLLVSKTHGALITENVREGDRLKADGVLEAARERYSVALSLCQDEAERDEILIKMEYQTPIQPIGSYTDNLQSIFSALGRSPDSPETLYNLATELAIEGHTLEAIRYLERVVILTPEDPDPVYRMANALADVEYYERAELAFAKAQKLGFEQAEIEFRMGQLARKQGDHPTAIDFFKKAITTNPEKIDALRGLASIHDVDGRYDSAIEYLTKVVEIDPEDAFSLFRLGELYENTGVPERAIEYWRQAKRVAPDSEAAGFAQDKQDASGEEGGD